MGIEKDKYMQLITDIEFEEIELIDLEVSKNKNHVSGAVGVEIDCNFTEVSKSEDSVNIPAKFSITASQVDSKEEFFTIKFVYDLTYSLNNADRYEIEELSQFAENNAPFNVWPYARELVSSLTSRMGFPALMLPTYKGHGEVE